MALGFAFNKAKILSSAEKFVQQGKLQNAIAEYEKVLKQDAKDLTVLNTIGDLYARLGRGDQAMYYFKKVGDAYAADGFVVKAIAMYKKLTKLNPSSLESVVRLAELYTQQGLYNDARAQYTTAADQYLKINDRESATGILKKMLDLDPENAAMQAKVADLYLKLGRNKDALEIYFNSAQSLHQQGSLDAAEKALVRVLKLDPNHAPALKLRGQIAAESGNSAAAVESLEKVTDVDSNVELVRPLLQAYLQTGDFDHAEPLATKLIEVHNDLSVVTLYANALLDAADPEQAIGLYVRYADRLLATNNQGFIDSLNSSISRAKDSALALQSMLTLLQKAGASGHALREVQELLAHAFVQAGELDKAADLYHELAEAEPDNPLHQQNYKQIISRMGKDPITRELSVEEGVQALMGDELEAPPALAQEYSLELAETINSALIDSELFLSYNVPEKAIAPLENVLPQAPNDARIRQRLASLYVRMGRFADAANCCAALAEVHAQAGLEDQAQQFRDLAAKYSKQAGGVSATGPVIELSTSEPALQQASQPISNMTEEAVPFQASSITEFSVTPPLQEPSVAEFDLSAVPADALPEATAEPVAETVETEHAEEWEDMLTVESPVHDEAGSQMADAGSESEVQEVTAEESPEEILEEAQFYISQGMRSEAQSAIGRLETIVPRHPALEKLRSTLSAQADAEAQKQRRGAPVADHGRPAATSKVESPKTSAPDFAASSASAGKQTGASGDGKDLLHELVLEEEGQQEQDVLDELIPELSAGERVPLTTPPLHVAPRVPAAPSMSTAANHTAANPLAGMVSDIEDALGEIAPSAPPAKTPATMPRTATKPHMPAVAATQSASVPPRMSAVPGEAQSMLSDLLEEFKEGIDEPAAEDDDPDTHYNLGVAFREMGLLDEAIGELQKVCRAVDSGVAFSQAIQAYTWLAHCFVEKGAPQAAIRWYERALNVKDISEDSRLAVYYDMATAFESAGNTKAALDNFMEVYGTNIDYRDVADRIRSLRK